jgi:trimeric autotransporter adhesin
LFLLILFASLSSKAQVNLTDGLIAYYPFSGNAGDSSGNGHDGTINNASLVQDRFGNNGHAYSFDGIKKGITIPSLGDFGSGGVTISLWVKTTKNGAAIALVQGRIGTLWMNVYKLGSFIAMFNGTIGNNTAADVSNTNIASGTWVNLTATNDGTTTKLYVNGVLEKSYAESLITGGSDFIIANQNFVGSIDDIRIYGRAISAAEALAIYNLTH